MAVRRSPAGPRVRRPRGGVYGAVRILPVEGRGYYVEPTDPEALPPDERTLYLSRHWKAAVAFVESGAADQLLAERLAKVAA